MITMNIITQSFGSGFMPKYPALNEFEQYCKDHWGTGVRCLLTLFNFESAADLVTAKRSAWWH